MVGQGLVDPTPIAGRQSVNGRLKWRPTSGDYWSLLLHRCITIKYQSNVGGISVNHRENINEYQACVNQFISSQSGLEVTYDCQIDRLACANNRTVVDNRCITDAQGWTIRIKVNQFQFILKFQLIILKDLYSKSQLIILKVSQLF